MVIAEEDNHNTFMYCVFVLVLSCFCYFFTCVGCVIALLLLISPHVAVTAAAVVVIVVRVIFFLSGQTNSLARCSSSYISSSSYTYNPSSSIFLYCFVFYFFSSFFDFILNTVICKRVKSNWLTKSMKEEIVKYRIDLIHINVGINF